MPSVRGPWDVGNNPRQSAWLPSRRRKSWERQAPLVIAAQQSLDAFFPQLLAHPVNHRCAGFQGLDDLVVAPSFADFRDVRLLQDPRLHQALRRAFSFPDQRCQLFTFAAAQPHNIFRA